MCRLNLLLLLQLVIVLCQGRYQGRGSRSGWRQGRDQEEDLSYLYDIEPGTAKLEVNLMEDQGTPAETEEDEEQDDGDLTTTIMPTDPPSQEAEGEEPSNSSSTNESSVKTKTYLNWGERCGSCAGKAEDPVCGSDGHTYINMCSLDYAACRKYWDIVLEYKVRTEYTMTFNIMHNVLPRVSARLPAKEYSLACSLGLVSPELLTRVLVTMTTSGAVLQPAVKG